jgi:hypothetical protein
MTAPLLIIAMLGSGGEPLCTEQSCDWCEWNNVCELTKSEEGIPYYRVTLVQVIWWRGAGRDECLAWRLAEKVDGIRQDERGVIITWHDGDVLRRTRAKFLLESWTLGDVEIASRELVPADHRRGLGGKPGEVTYRSWKQMRMKNP